MFLWILGLSALAVLGYYGYKLLSGQVKVKGLDYD